MELQLINHKSKWLKSVQLLGDSYSSTIGFLAQEAYVDYARKGRILVATHDTKENLSDKRRKLCRVHRFHRYLVPTTIHLRPKPYRESHISTTASF